MNVDKLVSHLELLEKRVGWRAKVSRLILSDDIDGNTFTGYFVALDLVLLLRLFFFLVGFWF